MPKLEPEPKLVSNLNGAVVVISRDNDDDDDDDDNIDEKYERELGDVDITMVDVDCAGKGGEGE